MHTSTRFSVAVHLLICVAAFQATRKVTSEFLAGSIGVNPVVARRSMARLKKAGLLRIAPGPGGASVARPASEITLLDVFRAVEAPAGPAGLFGMHSRPNPLCPVGRAITPLLAGHAETARHALEASLERTTLQNLMDAVPDLS